MADGVSGTNLPLSTEVVELIGNKDYGGGVRGVVRIELSDLVALLEAAFNAGAAPDAHRALAIANNASIRLRKLDDVQIVLKSQVFG